MKHPDMNAICQLTWKLKKEGDITLKEADWIYSLFSENSLKTKFNINSSKFDAGLIYALEEWYEVVAQKIRNGERGNFVFTVYLKNIVYSDFLYPAKKAFPYPAKKALLEQGGFKDLCNVIMVDEKTYSRLPFKHFLSKNSHDLGCYYEMNSPRAGMLYYPLKTEKGTYTVLQFLEKLVPFAIEVPPAWDARTFTEAFFEIAAKTQEITRNLWNVNNREISCFIMSDFIRHKDISCAAAVSLYDGESVLLVEKGQAPLVKEAMKISFEELVKNALTQNIINKKEAQSLLGGKPEYDFPIVEFTKASTQYLNEMVKRKMEWKSTREKVENEDMWFEEIR